MRAGWLLILLLGSSVGHYAVAENAAEMVDLESQTVVISKNIPYKQDKSLSEAAAPAITATLVFLALAAGFLFFYKTRLQQLHLTGDRNIKIIETTRLNTKLTAFEIQIKGKELLVLQSGDTIKVVDLAEKTVEAVE